MGAEGLKVPAAVPTCVQCSAPMPDDKRSCVSGYCKLCFAENVKKNQELVMQQEAEKVSLQDTPKELDLRELSRIARF